MDGQTDGRTGRRTGSDYNSSSGSAELKTLFRCYCHDSKFDLILLLQVLRFDLMHAVKKKRPNLNLEHIIFNQDNAPGHRAESSLLEINFLGFEILQHPPYSPGLAPLDFRVFPEIKAALWSIPFEDPVGFICICKMFPHTTLTGPVIPMLNWYRDKENAFKSLEIILKKSDWIFNITMRSLVVHWHAQGTPYCYCHLL